VLFYNEDVTIQADEKCHRDTEGSELFS